MAKCKMDCVIEEIGEIIKRASELKERLHDKDLSVPGIDEILIDQRDDLIRSEMWKYLEG